MNDTFAQSWLPDVLTTMLPSLASKLLGLPLRTAIAGMAMPMASTTAEAPVASTLHVRLLRKNRRDPRPGGLAPSPCISGTLMFPLPLEEVLAAGPDRQGA